MTKEEVEPRVEYAVRDVDHGGERGRDRGRDDDGGLLCLVLCLLIMCVFFGMMMLMVISTNGIKLILPKDADVKTVSDTSVTTVTTAGTSSAPAAAGGAVVAATSGRRPERPEWATGADAVAGKAGADVVYTPAPPENKTQSIVPNPGPFPSLHRPIVVRLKLFVRARSKTPRPEFSLIEESMRARLQDMLKVAIGQSVPVTSKEGYVDKFGNNVVLEEIDVGGG